MDRLFVPTLGASDWRRLLADPRKQWRRGRSAYELAVAWEAARASERGIPIAIAKALDSVPVLAGAKLILGLPELQVDLPGGGHASQTDLWALLEAGDNFVSLAVEAKAGEPLGDIVGDWLAKGKLGNRRQERLASISRQLSVPSADLGAIRYQLLHRAASALIMAERFRAPLAALLVVSFHEERDRSSLEAFRAFGRLLGANLDAGIVAEVRRAENCRLFAGWVCAAPATCEDLEVAV